jgi:hypothetical protein
MCSIDAKQQLDRDFVWCMRKKGKAVGLKFDLTMVGEDYYALQQGRSVSPRQVDKIIQGYYVTEWQPKYQPAMRGTTLLPDPLVANNTFRFLPTMIEGATRGPHSAMHPLQTTEALS